MATYSLPPQLEQTPDFAGKFLSGVQIGAAIGEAKNKLAQSQQQFAVEAQQKSDQITASALKEAQELAVSKAYNDQQISLKQQQLQIADQKVGQETLKAARQYQASQNFKTRYQELLSQNGGDQDAAARGAMFENLDMLGTGAGAGAAAMRAVSSQKASVPKTTVVYDSSGRPHTMATLPGSGVLQDLDRSAGTDRMADWQTRYNVTRRDKVRDQQLSDLKGQRKAAQKLVSDAEEAHWDQGKNAAALQSYKTRVSNLQQINQQIQGLMNAGASAPTPTGDTTADETDESLDIPNAAPSDQGGGQPQARSQAAIPNFKVVAVNDGQQSAAPVAAPAPQAAAPKAAAVSIPGISATKPLSASEKASSAKYQIASKEDIAAGRAQQEQLRAQQQKARVAQTYTENKKEAASIYSAMRSYQANPEATSVTQETWNSRLSRLNELLQKLTPEDRDALTGQNDLE